MHVHVRAIVTCILKCVGRDSEERAVCFLYPLRGWEVAAIKHYVCLCMCACVCECMHNMCVCVSMYMLGHGYIIAHLPV